MQRQTVSSAVFLFAELAACTLVQLATEPLLYQIMQAVAERLQLHVVDDFIDERILQEHLRLLERNATLLHIEERCVVELTYR